MRQEIDVRQTIDYRHRLAVNAMWCLTILLLFGGIPACTCVGCLIMAERGAEHNHQGR